MSENVFKRLLSDIFYKSKEFRRLYTGGGIVKISKILD